MALNRYVLNISILLSEIQRKREARNFLSVIIVQQLLVKTISYSSHLIVPSTNYGSMDK